MEDNDDKADRAVTPWIPPVFRAVENPPMPTKGETGRALSVNLVLDGEDGLVSGVQSLTLDSLSMLERGPDSEI